jgi:hypothetical protein
MDACLALTIGSRERAVRIEDIFFFFSLFFLDFLFSLSFISNRRYFDHCSNNKKVDRIVTQFDLIRNLINLPTV